MLEKIEALDTKKGFYAYVLIVAIVLGIVWNIGSAIRHGGSPESLRSESDQTKAKSELYAAKLQDRKVELDFRMQNRKLDFQTEFLAKQQKEEDVRRVNQLIEMMNSDLPQAEKGQQKLDELLTSNTGMTIANVDEFVRLFERLYNQPRAKPDDIRFRLKEAQALRDEMLKEDPVTRAETRGDELSLMEKWESEARASVAFYTEAQLQVTALLQEGQTAGTGGVSEIVLTSAVTTADGVTHPQEAKRITVRRGPKVTLQSAIQRLHEQDVHEKMFPTAGNVTRPVTQ